MARRSSAASNFGARRTSLVVISTLRCLRTGRKGLGVDIVKGGSGGRKLWLRGPLPRPRSRAPRTSVRRGRRRQRKGGHMVQIIRRRGEAGVARDHEQLRKLRQRGCDVLRDA